MDTELKPCPFCGEEAGICEANDIFFHRDDDGNKIFGGWRCFCPSCAIEQIGYETREEAVSAWNNRSTEHATHRAPVDEKGGGRMTGIERLRALAYKKNFLEPAEARELDAIADQIEREYDAGVADSPYDDLLPQEDREAIAWVRDHGGLDAVKKRTMPEDMSWPFYEDGEPVRLGEHWQQDGYDWSITSIDSIEFAEDGVRFENEYADAFYRYGERVKRPAPKVLDADGAEIRVGDTVYYVDGREQRVNTVARLTDDGCVQFGRINEAGYVTYCEAACIQPNLLTHRAPVPASDGKPLREGEHVYHVETGTELVVKRLPKPGEYQAVVVFALPTSPASHLTSFDPDQLTHQRPVADTWERLEEDAEKDPCGYFGFDGEETCGKCPASGKNCEQTMAQDLVRRCRALAERERGE